jgi:hypothetical protein
MTKLSATQIAAFCSTIGETIDTMMTYAGDILTKEFDCVSDLSEQLAKRAVKQGGGEYSEREQYFYDALFDATKTATEFERGAISHEGYKFDYEVRINADGTLFRDECGQVDVEISYDYDNEHLVELMEDGDIQEADIIRNLLVSQYNMPRSVANKLDL